MRSFSIIYILNHWKVEYVNKKRGEGIKMFFFGGGAKLESY